MGVLSSSLNYPSGSKLLYEIDGQTFRQEMPFRSIQIPQGEYQAKVVNEVLGFEKEVHFKIEENKENRLD